MSAINAACQPAHGCLHLVTDAAQYLDDGTVTGFGSKVMTVPHWPGAITSRGTSVALPLIGYSLANQFQSFDDLVRGISEALPEIIAIFGLSMTAEVVVAGFSAERNAPEAYVIETSDNLPKNMTQDERDAGRAAGSSSEIFNPEAFCLVRLPDVVTGPVIQDDMIIAANFEGINVTGDPEAAIAGLRKVIEMQRHDLREDGVHWVGGFAQLTTITRDGISQRILHRWDEDRIGEPIKPSPIFWPAWNAAHARGGGTVSPLSRLQRERMEKKARKAAAR